MFDCAGAAELHPNTNCSGMGTLSSLGNRVLVDYWCTIIFHGTILSLLWYQLSWEENLVERTSSVHHIMLGPVSQHVFCHFVQDFTAGLLFVARFLGCLVVTPE